MVKGLLPLVFALGISTAIAEVRPTGGGYDVRFPVAVNDTSTGIKTLIYEQWDVFLPSIIARLWSQQSLDGGSTWSPPQAVSLGPTHAPQIVTSIQGGASLLNLAGGGYLLFHHFGGASPADIWRTYSADGSSFVDSSLVDPGWPATGSGHAGSGFPSVVLESPTSMSMLYQRFAADGSSPTGIYLARSNDGGLTWSPLRTLVATDAHLGVRSMLAFRSSDHRYAATYEKEFAAEDNRVMIKVTDDVSDWSAPATLEIAGNNSAPALVVMPDGAFVVVYARKMGDQLDLFARRSTDGNTWAAEVRLTHSENWDDYEPFAVAGTSTDTVELYWVQMFRVSPTSTDIVHAPVVVWPDALFANGFDQ